MKKKFNMALVILLASILMSTVAKAEPKQTTPIVWEDGGEPAKKGEQQISEGVSSGVSTNGGVFGSFDEEPPVIKGIKKRIVFIGDKVNYKKGIKVIDDCDGNITKKLKVNSKNVNLKKVGTYKIVYSATDKEGNKTTKTTTITVKNPEN